MGHLTMSGPFVDRGPFIDKWAFIHDNELPFLISLPFGHE